MMPEDSTVVRILRTQAWERAKGELHAVLQTYYGGSDNFDQMDTAVGEFIARVEDNGWHE